MAKTDIIDVEVTQEEEVEVKVYPKPDFGIEKVRQTTLEMMMEYIQEYAPEEKGWFKKVAFMNKAGEVTKKYNHINAVKQFYKKFDESALSKEKLSEVLRGWK